MVEDPGTSAGGSGLAPGDEMMPRCWSCGQPTVRVMAGLDADVATGTGQHHLRLLAAPFCRKHRGETVAMARTWAMSTWGDPAIEMVVEAHLDRVMRELAEDLGVDGPWVLHHAAA